MALWVFSLFTTGLSMGLGAPLIVTLTSSILALTAILLALPIEIDARRTYLTRGRCSICGVREDWRAILRSRKGRRRRSRWHTHHIIPLPRSGVSSVTNLLVLCPECDADMYMPPLALLGE
ncbi:HNH endonuclease signature motif containing protein [Actinoplanes sp. NPDC049668]|uniref:HNH endonuclease n=1 Tax=unclassified Actinoplanes TaxID=2626549 RepID=UPI0033A9FC46